MQVQVESCSRWACSRDFGRLMPEMPRVQCHGVGLDLSALSSWTRNTKTKDQHTQTHACIKHSEGHAALDHISYDL